MSKPEKKLAVMRNPRIAIGDNGEVGIMLEIKLTETTSTQGFIPISDVNFAEMLSKAGTVKLNNLDNRPIWVNSEDGFTFFERMFG